MSLRTAPSGMHWMQSGVGRQARRAVLLLFQLSSGLPATPRVHQAACAHARTSQHAPPPPPPPPSPPPPDHAGRGGGNSDGSQGPQQAGWDLPALHPRRSEAHTALPAGGRCRVAERRGAKRCTEEPMMPSFCCARLCLSRPSSHLAPPLLPPLGQRGFHAHRPPTPASYLRAVRPRVPQPRRPTRWWTCGEGGRWAGCAERRRPPPSSPCLFRLPAPFVGIPSPSPPPLFSGSLPGRLWAGGCRLVPPACKFKF